MSAETYFEKVGGLLEKIRTTQMENIQAAAGAFATSILAGRAVHIFGSGHSVLPVQDIFPRYGAYVGFHPIMDPRLMWSNVVGPGGARELLWLHNQTRTCRRTGTGPMPCSWLLWPRWGDFYSATIWSSSAGRSSSYANSSI